MAKDLTHGNVQNARKFFNLMKAHTEIITGVFVLIDEYARYAKDIKELLAIDGKEK